MTFDWQRIIESKQALRRDLAARPVAEKLRMLDILRERQLAIRRSTANTNANAVREDRQYRKAMTREQALQILREGSGTVFDPKVISAFLEHLDEFEAEIRSMRVEPHRFEDRRAKKVAETSRLDNDHKAFERIRSANRELITL